MSEDDSSFFGGVIRAWRAAPELGGDIDPWRDDAACRGQDPELFFPHKVEDSVHYHKARVFCARCPSVTPCLEYALKHHITHGLWGSKTPRERRVILRKRRAA